MKLVKLAIVVCGLAGLASCFIGELAPFKLRDVPGLRIAVYMMLVGFAAAAAMGVAALVKPPTKSWQPALALAGNVACILFFRKIGALGDLAKATPFYENPNLASVLFGIGFYGGILSSIVWLVKRDD
jgi:hypothetical protein